MTTTWRCSAGSLVTAVDRVATFVFAMEGALAATYYDVDIFGVLVLGFSTALVGGIVRDLVLGDTPPASLRGPVYPLIAFAGGAVVLFVDQVTDVIPIVLIQLTDAVGLSLFAVVGTMKALDHGLNGLVAALLGAVSAVGGGVVRDMMLNIVPIVLRSQVYAIAALLGAFVTVVAFRLRTRRATAMALGFAACLVLRVVAVSQDWNLPHID